jgi:hypothetical protein
MRWFGPGEPFSNACAPELRMPTPVGANCDYCEEVFEPLDTGYLLPRVRNPEQLAVLWGKDPSEPADVMELVDLGVLFIAEHYECQMVHIIGHVRCLLTHGAGGVCPSDADRDPPGMTRRQAAQLAEQLFQEDRQGLLTERRKASLLRMLFPSAQQARA